MKTLHFMMTSMHWKHQGVEPSFGIGTCRMSRRPEMIRLAVSAAAMTVAVAFSREQISIGHQLNEYDTTLH